MGRSRFCREFGIPLGIHYSIPSDNCEATDGSALGGPQVQLIEVQGIAQDIQDAAEAGIQEMDKFANKMDGNILYYVAAILDPRIKRSKADILTH